MKVKVHWIIDGVAEIDAKGPKIFFGVALNLVGKGHFFF